MLLLDDDDDADNDDDGNANAARKGTAKETEKRPIGVAALEEDGKRPLSQPKQETSTARSLLLVPLSFVLLRLGFG